MVRFCSCGTGECYCVGRCCCCPCTCRCENCIAIRNTRLSEKCKHLSTYGIGMIESPEAAANSGLAAPKPLVSTRYPGVRFDKLPNLDFLNQRSPSGATGYSSNSITVSKRNDPPQARRLSSSASSEDELIFQMDDIDASLTSTVRSSFPRSYSTPGSLQVGTSLGDELSNETSRQLKAQTHTEVTKYSPSKLTKSREPSPPCTFSVSPSSVSPKKSPNCLSKSDPQISGCPRSILPDSDSQLSTEQISPEIKTQSLSINGNDVDSNSASKPSDEEVEPDQQESSKSDFSGV